MDAGSNTTAGTIHWNNGASQKIFWHRAEEGEKSVKNVKASKATTGEPDTDTSGDNPTQEEANTKNTEVGENTEHKNDQWTGLARGLGGC